MQYIDKSYTFHKVVTLIVDVIDLDRHLHLELLTLMCVLCTSILHINMLPLPVENVKLTYLLTSCRS